MAPRTRARRPRWRALSVLLAVAVTLTACTSTSDGGRRDADAAVVGDDSAGLTDTEIHVGVVVGNKQFADAAVGIQARFAQVNEDGGVHGRKIVVDKVADDGGAAASAVTAVRSLVQQDGVFALVTTSSFLANTKPFIEQQGVPTFGFGFDDAWCNSDYTFAYNGCPAGTTPHTSNVAHFVGQLFPDKTVKGHTIAVVGDDGASSMRTAKLYGSVIKAQGGNLVLTQNTMPGASSAPVSDYTPYATEVMRSAGGKAPEYVMTITTAQNTLGMTKALIGAGYKGIRQDFTMYDPRLVRAAAGGNELMSMQPWEVDTPRMKEAIAAIRTVKADQRLTLPLGYGYWSADMFVKMLEKAGKDLTRSSLVKMLNDNFSIIDGEGVGKLEFPRMHGESAGCLAWVSSDGKTYTVRAKLSCVELIDNPTA
ncbi:ABC transporter substrate-binding protein [Cryptosporangium aurantiacum]|uniref:Amino acid/amide ABC transporter substrate-binding protein, HAAT family n=1 Tax=Cryptosporangium aurantiacum TaxID=134849 RepID=A0A1M7TY79_9ACTN|nr:ABC transporter substrate-binding protein [Cryptosporangium aurantiacum]SHN75722.1 amino acid/amide ABC transporter substrate-binding protein, HAAT family [Cryptosporangium aurantiacum]